MSQFDELSRTKGISGLLSLKMFVDHPFTIDYPNKQIIFETGDSLQEREKLGAQIHISFEQQIPPSLTTQLNFVIGDEVQPAMIDTGSAPTKLPMKFFTKLGLDSKSPTVRHKKITTIAGFETEALFAAIPGKISLKDAPQFKNADPTVRFDHSLRMGSIGGDFFMDKIVTFDLANKRILISK